MKEHTCELEKYDSAKRNRYRCPNCGKDKVFTRYIDTITKQYIGADIGKCSRLNKCKYHNPPSGTIAIPVTFKRPRIKAIPPRRYLSKSKYRAKLCQYSDNNRFANFLCDQIGVENAHKVIDLYKLGTNGTATLFPYFDEFNNLVTYKTIKYQFNGKRERGEYSSYYDSNKNKYPFPLFGVWQIHSHPDKPIAIVESEKTAVLMSYYHPDFIWLATGSANMLQVYKIHAIKDRSIVLYPDVGMFEYWHEKMRQIEAKYPRIQIVMSRECEIWYNDNFLKNGDDIADYYTSAYKWNHGKQEIQRQEIKPNMILHYNSGKIKF